MNKKQHFFIWVGIALLTIMAITLESKLTWLVAAMLLIAESVYLCKDAKFSDREVFFLILAILVFFILFIKFLPGRRKATRAAPIIRRKSSLLTHKRTPITTSLTLDEMAKTKKT